MKKKNLPYRPCVGIALFNDDNHVFVAERIDTPGAWQMPQGGIDKHEKPKAAALRELKEEIGTNKGEIIAKTDDWLRYDLPDRLIGKVWKGKYRGQEQKWFAIRFKGTDEDINIRTKHPEFARWKWVDFETIPDLIVPFKRDLYLEVVKQFRPLLSDTLS
jgi:putative (di)nucleoside polyphosphate hydrolase